MRPIDCVRLLGGVSGRHRLLDVRAKTLPFDRKQFYLVDVTGATGHDRLDRRISAVLRPVFCAAPIWGAEVRFLLRLVPQRWWPGWGPCSEQERLPRALNKCSRLLLSWSNLAAISRCTSSLVEEVIVW